MRPQLFKARRSRGVPYLFKALFINSSHIDSDKKHNKSLTNRLKNHLKHVFLYWKTSKTGSTISIMMKNACRIRFEYSRSSKTLQMISFLVFYKQIKMYFFDLFTPCVELFKDHFPLLSFAFVFFEHFLNLSYFTHFHTFLNFLIFPRLGGFSPLFL